MYIKSRNSVRPELGSWLLQINRLIVPCPSRNDVSTRLPGFPHARSPRGVLREETIASYLRHVASVAKPNDSPESSPDGWTPRCCISIAGGFPITKHKSMDHGILKADAGEGDSAGDVARVPLPELPNWDTPVRQELPSSEPHHGETSNFQTSACQRVKLYNFHFSN